MMRPGRPRDLDLLDQGQRRQIEHGDGGITAICGKPVVVLCDECDAVSVRVSGISPITVPLFPSITIT